LFLEFETVFRDYFSATIIQQLHTGFAQNFQFKFMMLYNKLSELSIH